MVYIPRINDDVFLIGALNWEWGIVVRLMFTHRSIPDMQFGMIFVYLAATELYKWVKRIYARRHSTTANRAPSDKTLRMERTIALKA